MTDHDLIEQRLFAVLDYDCIPEHDRVKHLMNKCNQREHRSNKEIPFTQNSRHPPAVINKTNHCYLIN
jgi:hypothetical protein